MAVDGRKIRQTLYQGSDIEHDFPCSPCSKGGKNEAAIKHCVECDENLCQSCMDDHNKFSSMKGHQLLDTVKQPSGRQQELPSQRCEEHGGKLIDVFCPGHDTVCCSTCISVEHSGCKGIIFIPDIACKTDTSQKLKLLETEINTLQARFHAFKRNKQDELENVKEEKGKLIEEIKSERGKINDRLDKMENELLQEADAIFQIKLKRIESNMKEVDARIAVLQESLQKINAAKRENESEKYIQIKRVNEERKTASDCLKDFERPSKTGRLRFDPYRHETGSECNTIGSILHLPAIEVEKCFGEFNVRTADDRNRCDICDMCMCKSGCIVMTDYNNKRIRKMNSAFKVISSLKLSGNPFGICEINSLMLAISVYQGKFC
ncbi:E3 ubiquitin-protein ligase TRIM33-like [Ruditapes philippinarum]|uniref:E3 ubiquitin-protein ligase TRIM33-like n=1 Tax=Ruditapes philippinarum TaxID=129788 RepID=UPI00295AB398|nr:E3 ubiquitin-protein ligase TRIM33-like [Ruditapes philippinarum]